MRKIIFGLVICLSLIMALEATASTSEEHKYKKLCSIWVRPRSCNLELKDRDNDGIDELFIGEQIRLPDVCMADRNQQLVRIYECRKNGFLLSDTFIMRLSDGNDSHWQEKITKDWYKKEPTPTLKVDIDNDEKAEEIEVTKVRNDSHHEYAVLDIYDGADRSYQNLLYESAGAPSPEFAGLEAWDFNKDGIVEVVVSVIGFRDCGYEIYGLRGSEFSGQIKKPNLKLADAYAFVKRFRKKHPKPSAPLKAILKADKQSYTLGEQVKLNLKLTGKREINLSKCAKYFLKWLLCYIKPLSSSDVKLYSLPIGHHPLSTVSHADGGEIILKMADYGIARLGKYQIWLECRFSPETPTAWTGTVVTNPVKVSIKIRSKQEQREKLPDKIKSILDKKYPDWKFPDVSEDFLAYFKSEKLSFYPNLIWGDFDDDGEEDYAAQIIYGDGRGAVIVFLRQDEKFVDHVLTTGPALSPSLVYLHLFKKGEEDYDYETEKKFQYPSDSIGMLGSKAGVSYIFENGKFRRVASSD